MKLETKAKEKFMKKWNDFIFTKKINLVLLKLMYHFKKQASTDFLKSAELDLS